MDIMVIIMLSALSACLVALGVAFLVIIIDMIKGWKK